MAIRLLGLILGLGLIVGFSGCADLTTSTEGPSNDSSTSTQVDDHDDHDHSHDHHHDHGGYRPADFLVAVEDLVEDHESLRVMFASEKVQPAQLDEQLHRVRSLARMIPELAADSDMPEPFWNRVYERAGQLQTQYESAISRFDQGGQITTEELSMAGQEVNQLQSLADEADPDWFPQFVTDAEQDTPEPTDITDADSR